MMRLLIPQKLAKSVSAEAVLQKAREVEELPLSAFQFQREYQEAMVAYVVDVVRDIYRAVAEKFGVRTSEIGTVRKSFPVSMLEEFLSKPAQEAPELLKALFENPSRKKDLAKYYKKFGVMGRPRPKPVKFEGETFKNFTTGKPMTEVQLRAIENAVVGSLKGAIKGLDEELAVRSCTLGLLQATPRELREAVKTLGWDKIVVPQKYKNGEMPRSIKSAKEHHKFGPVMEAAIHAAKRRAGEFLSIEDGAIKKTVAKTVRDVIVGSLEDGVSAQKMASRLFHMDPEDALGAKYSKLNLEVLARDWRRVCFPRGTKVLTDAGPKPIEEVQVGERVTTHTGSSFSVVQQHKRQYTGGMTTVETKSGSVLTATDNHEVYVSRKGKMLWLPISSLMVGDQVVRAKGWNTYRDPYWLRHQHHDLGKHCRAIADECGVCGATIQAQMKLFGIPVRRDLAFRGKQHTEGYCTKMSLIARAGNWVNGHLGGSKHRAKAIATQRKQYAEGLQAAWNKGKKCPEISRGVKASYAGGRTSWCKGLTKETSPSLRSGGKKHSARLRSGTFAVLKQRQQQSETLARKIADGWSTFSAAKRGHLLNKSTGEIERYQSSYEKAYMEKCNDAGVAFTRNHGIVIPYVDGVGKLRRYIPDFFESASGRLVEIKPSLFVEKDVENTQAKIRAAQKLCAERGWNFVVLTEKELFGEQQTA